MSEMILSDTEEPTSLESLCTISHKEEKITLFIEDYNTLEGNKHINDKIVDFFLLLLFKQLSKKINLMLALCRHIFGKN